MKRIASSILVLLMLLSFSALFAVAENGVTVIDGGAYVSISVGKKYTSTGTRYANSAYSDTDAAGNMLGKLTDGSISTNGTANIAAHEGNETDVVIDLEEICEIKAVQTDLWGNTSWGIATPTKASVDFYYSADGEGYTMLGKTSVVTEKASDWTQCVFTAKSDMTVSARYIRVHYNLGGARFRWSSEISVLGTGSIPENEHRITEADGVKYIRDFENGAELSDVFSAFGGRKITVRNAKGNEKTTGMIGTGDIITDGESEYVAVVRGDLSGDGKINTGDYVALRRAILNQVKLSKAQEFAGDIDKNGKLQAKDYIVLRKFLLKLVDDLDGTVRQAVTMPEITDFRSSSFKKTATGITIEAKETQTDGHSVKVTMVKTAWGTWNLGRYDAIENATGKTVTLNPGGTDWEYVYRVGETAGDITFCGGNHGNEKLVDIKFYDAKSGRELNDNDTADGVRIVERTQIYYNNKPDKPFVNVVRTYVINGADVWLECDYDFIRDALFNLSYTAMACIPKANGNHIVYYNTDGTTKEFSTALHGTKSGTDYGGDFDKGNPAPYVEMYGDSNPEYRMTVRVYDPYVMCDDFIYADKTMFWDMNSTQNKLYFCKFDNSKPHKVTKGTHWDTLTKWAFLKTDG